MKILSTRVEIRKEELHMNGITMMVIAIVVLGGAYLLYGRYLERKWGIDPNAKRLLMRWRTA